MSSMVRPQGAGHDTDKSGLEWRKSSRSYGAGECVEVAAPYGERIDVRDSRNPQGAVLRFTSAEWSAFITVIRTGRPGL